MFNGPAAVVIEDYAHHPAEIAALLAALRAAWPRHRLAAVFQSHRFSRTKQFLDGFASALAAADSVHLLETYGAGERPLPGGGLSDLRAALRKTAPNLPVSAGAPALEKISATADAPAVIAFIGAGDIHRHARALARRLACAEWDALARRLVARREEPLAPKTTLRIGGAARLYAEPENTDDLRRLVRAAREAGVPVFMLGRGSNLVVPDNGLDALVIALRGPGWERVELLPNGDIFAAAGCRLQRLCAFAMSRGIAGFEALAGIPASLGGALRMNAGAHGVSLLERVVELHRLSPAGNVARLPRGRLGAGYRRCAALEKTGAIALGAVLRGTGADAPEAIAARMRAFAAQRRRSQPREPSAGCVFRNPPGDSAGRLIDAAGLKGLRVGGARVSPVHANFIVNTGGATAADFLALARLVREKVAQKHALTLAPEILFPGGL
ncbi:MAG: UDP-N-acetylmuramate dehydrogenase [Opitutaceae bacterium]|nr:UDP-N-acetylmuramate dehydrogenase [Opitutaceae bacterium]